MQRAHAGLERAGDTQGAAKLRRRMETLAGGLHRDPQLESALRQPRPRAGVEDGAGRSIGQELAQSIGGARGRDRGMSL
jgi:hypothetical protein